MAPGKAAGAVSEKRTHFLRLGSHGDREKAGAPVLCRTGLDCHSSTITGPTQSVLEKLQSVHRNPEITVQALTLLLISFVTMGKLFNLLGPEM